MKALELLRRAAGKSPRYLIHRGFQEVRRRVRVRGLRRRLQALSPASVAREAGHNSLVGLWNLHAPNAYCPGPDTREELRRLYRKAYSSEEKALRSRVEKILAHEFDLLGSGPTPLGPEIDWHLDFKSGRKWELVPSGRIGYAELDKPSDVKVPWELSRSQHLTTLGRAWVVDRDERCVTEFEQEIRSWMRQNPVGLGVNWVCTMDVALRAVNWIWALGLFDDAPLSREFRESVLLSLYQHGLWIPEHLELGEVNGNHFLANALGLVACGSVFRDSVEGKRWLDLGAEFLEREIRLQVEDDGVDIEGSVPYHRLVLEIFLVGLRFLETAGRMPSKEYRDRIEKMIEFVHAYVTPDGLSPVIGDADDGRVLILGETNIRDHRYLLSTGCALFGRADWRDRSGRFWEDSLWFLGPSALSRFESLKPFEHEETSQAFPNAGFYILRSPAHYLFADVGPVGFRGHGGHGHNDCLSFEWHAHGRPALLDSGTFVYTASPEWRNLFRSTSFHNTVRCDREEINRIPSPLSLWSLRDDAQPIEVDFRPGKERDMLQAGHTGYRRLRDSVTIFRTFDFDRHRSCVRLLDRLEGTEEHFIEFFFHGAPEALAHRLSAKAVEFRWPGGFRIRIEQAEGPALAWDESRGWFSPSYGVKIARPVWMASAFVRLPLSIVWNLNAEV